MATKGIKRTIRHNALEKGITVRESFNRFIAEKEALNKSASTLRQYEQTYNYFISYSEVEEDSLINEITKDIFLYWLNYMKQQNMNPNTINNYIRGVRAWLYWCMDIEQDLLVPFKIQEVTLQESAPKAFEESDIEALLVKPSIEDSFTDWRSWAIVNWIMATGNRQATVCEVRIGDVDFRRNEIYLRHCKNTKYQMQPLSKGLAAALKEYMKEFRAYFDNADVEDCLFPNSEGEQLTTNALRHAFTHYCKSRGVEQSNIHGLRHSFAIQFLQNGGNQIKLQYMLGHSSLAMTQKYARLNVEHMKQDYEEFSPLDNMQSKFKGGERIKHTIRRRK